MPNRGAWVAVVIMAVVFALTTVALSALLVGCAVVGCRFLSGVTCSRPLTETEKCPVNSAVSSNTIDSWANGTCNTVKTSAGLERQVKLSFYKNLFRNVTDMVNRHGCRDVRCSGKHCKQHQESCPISSTTTRSTTGTTKNRWQTTPLPFALTPTPGSNQIPTTPGSGSAGSGGRPRRGIKNDGPAPCRR